MYLRPRVAIHSLVTSAGETPALRPRIAASSHSRFANCESRASLLPRRPPPPCLSRRLPELQHRPQRLGRILWRHCAELIVRVDAVAGAADAYFAGLEGQPVTLADDDLAAAGGLLRAAPRDVEVVRLLLVGGVA